MDELYELSNKKLNELEQLCEHVEKLFESAPEGTLRISKNQFYHVVDKGDTSGKYIKKKNQKLIRDLAQKDYNIKLLKAVEKKKSTLQQLLDSYIPDSEKQTFEKLSSERQKLVKPYYLPDKQFIEEWERINYPIIFHPEEGKEIYTEKGEAVRSKSEKILADKLKLLEIPYHYEKPLQLKGFGVVHPDFTVLNKRTRKVYYWEHFGIMDDQDYCVKAIKKIETMEKNGIFPGRNLIITCETANHPLNVRIVELLINEYLL